MPATAGDPAAVSHRVTGYLALLVYKYLKNITLKMAASIAIATYYHRSIHLLQFLLKALHMQPQVVWYNTNNTPNPQITKKATGHRDRLEELQDYWDNNL